MNRRLYRCRDNRVLAGVAGGVAEYFDLDPSLVRVFWFLSIFVGGFGVLLYLAMAIIVPLEPEGAYMAGTQTGEPTAEGDAPVPSATDWHTAAANHRHVSRGSGRAASIFGIILILFGSLALVDAFLPAWADGGRFLWPAFIVGIGALLVVTAVRREPTEP